MIITVAILLALPVFAYIALQFSGVQQSIADKVAAALEKKLHTHISVSTARFRLFNTVNLNDLYIADLAGDTLVYTKKAGVKLDFFRLFTGKIIIRGAEIDGFYGNIKMDTAGTVNFEFIIKAFKKPDAEPAVVNLELKKLKILNSRLNYTNLQKNDDVFANNFNPNHINISSLNTEISINLLTQDTLSASVKSLAFREKSGFTLKNLATQISASNTGITVDFLNVALENTSFKISDFTAKFDSLALLTSEPENVKVSFDILPSEILLKDLVCFAPDLQGFTKQINIQGKVSGTMQNLKVNKLLATFGNSLTFSADCDFTGLPAIDETFVYAKINEIRAKKSDIQDIISMMQHQPFVLPNEIDRLGTAIFRGNISGFFSNLVAYGNLSTAVGTMQSDLLVQFSNNFQNIAYSGSLKSANIKLDKLLNNNELGNFSFVLSTNGAKTEKDALKGKINATVREFSFRNYPYNNLQISGSYDGTGFNGKMSLDDENVKFDFSGLADLTAEVPTFNFDLNVEDVNLNALKIINSYPDLHFAFDGKINMTGASPDDLNGYLNISNIFLKNNGKTLAAGDLTFDSQTRKDFSDYSISSKYLNGSISGNFNFADLEHAATHLVQYYLPALSSYSENEKEKNAVIDIDLKMSNLNEITDLFAIPYNIDGVLSLKGNLDAYRHRINISGSVPSLINGNLKIDNISLNLLSNINKLTFTLRAQNNTKESGLLNFYFNATAANDSLAARFGWQNTQQITNAGEVSASAKIQKTNGLLTAQMELLPTKIIIKDTVWNINRCKIDYRADSSLNISNFRFGNPKQYITANGTVSKDENENLFVVLNEIDLDYIFRLLKLNSFTIGGIATGEANMRGLLKEPVIEAEIDVKNVTLNGKIISDAQISSVWDNSLKQIVLGGKFFSKNSDTVCVANGIYEPKTDSLDLVFDADGLSISFLNKYFNGIASNVDGRGYGAFHLFGPTKYLVFDGNIFVDNGQATIDVLQSSFYFSDTIKLSSTSVKFNNIQLSDRENNHGSITGSVIHNGQWKDMRYKIDITANNILAMNTKMTDNEFFYGKVYASGNVNITGSETASNIKVRATTQNRTKCYIQMSSASQIVDNDFIRFINPQLRTDIVEPATERRTQQNRTGTEQDTQIPQTQSVTNIDMQLEVTPAAQIELIIDHVSGDQITAIGTGSLRVQMDESPDIKLRGTYTIEQGMYNFTMQTFFHKSFKIDKGSSITWNGDPANADVNIRGMYSLKTKLYNLYDEDTANIYENTQVNCILNLTDKLMSPTIKFDIELPQSDEKTRQYVRNIISTNEMMYQQVAALLLTNNFIPPYQATAAFGNQAFSFATTTLSSYFNNLLSKATNSNIYSINLDVRQVDATERLYEATVGLNWQPNSRLSITVNGGYKNYNIENGNPYLFTGDADLDYRLNRVGNLSVKAYVHTVERLDIGIKPMLGAGLSYREDFDSFTEMFKYYWRVLSGKKKEKEDVTRF